MNRATTVILMSLLLLVFTSAAQVQVSGSGGNCHIDFELVDNTYMEGDQPLNGKPMYLTVPSLKSGIAWNFHGENKWIIADAAGEVWYENSADTPLPPETGWVKVTGSALCNDGVSLVLTGNVSPLPVELVFFAASYGWKENKVRLRWQTAAELNNKGFEVERSADGSSWQNIGFVQGKGTIQETVNYSFQDVVRTPGLYYYRIRQIDLDGQFSYSEVEAVEVRPRGELSVAVFPNPAREVVWVNASEHAGTLEVLLFNSSGQEVRRVSLEVEEETISLHGLAAGIYQLCFYSGGLAIGKATLAIK